MQKGAVLLSGVAVVGVLFGGCAEHVGRQAADQGVGDAAAVIASGDDGRVVRVGVYDSRSIAVAFAGTAKSEAQFQEKIDAYRQAEADGDMEKMKRIKQWMNDRQAEAHRQAFGTAGVEGILQQYQSGLEAIKTRDHLKGIVSKWDKAALEKYGDVERVDVTMQLIDMIGPNAKQRRSAVEIQKHKPLTTKQLNRAFKKG